MPADDMTPDRSRALALWSKQAGPGSPRVSGVPWRDIDPETRAEAEALFVEEYGRPMEG